MTITITELLNSRPIQKMRSGYSVTRRFKAVEDDLEERPINPESVIAGLAYEIGDEHPALSDTFITDISVDPIADSDGCLTIEIKYQPKQRAESENQYGETWEWGIISQEQHTQNVLHSSLQLNYPETANVGCAIGVDGDSINGVDFYQPACTLKVTQRIPETGGNGLYNKLSAIKQRLDTVNEHAWQYYDIGEVLFIGAQIQKSQDDEYIIEYNFLIKRITKTPVIILADGSTVGPLTPCPWDYCWAQHEIQTDPVTGLRIFKIKSVHIAKLYGASNFSAFGLNGPI